MADELRLVKAFHRPDAGKEEQLPSDLRPPAVLQKTVRYLLDKVASPSSSLAEHHKFVWDRTRCIRNDFTIQASGRLDDIKIAIECYEDIARFHIISLHQMPKIGKHDYDAQQELEQLSATLLTLFEYYDDNRGKYEAPREAEFRAYKLLIDIRSRTNDTFERVQTWPPRIRDAYQVQIAVQICQASGNVLTDTTNMLSPYSRAVRVEQAQYEKFWSILESPKVDYLMACAATVSFNEIRARTLDTMAKVYRSGPQTRMQDISLEELTFSLGFDSKSQTRRLFRETGLHLSKHANGVSYLDLDELTGPLPRAAILTADQMFSRSIVEFKRENRALSAIYNGFDVAHCKENGLLDDSDSDTEFQPDEEDLDPEEEEESLFVDEDKEDQIQEAPMINPSKPANPFSSFAFGHTIQKPMASGFGGFGQPTRAETTTTGVGQSSIPLIPSNTSASTPTASNRVVQPKQPNTGLTSGSIFGQPSSLPNQTTDALSAENSTRAPAGGFLFPSLSGSLSNGVATGLFQSKLPASSSVSMLSTQSKQDVPPALNLPDQVSEQPVAVFGGLPPSVANDPAQSMLPPSIRRSSNKNADSISASSETKFQSSTSMFDSKASVPSTTMSSIPTPDQRFSATSLSGQSSLKTFMSAPLHEQKKLDSLKPQAGNNETSHPPVLGSLQSASSSTPGQIMNSGSSVKSPSQKVFSAKPSTIEQQAAAAKQVETALKAHRKLIQRQKDAALERIARYVLLCPSGILEQFIEAELGPIYNKAQSKVTKERTQARLAEIQQSLLVGKFVHLWRQRVEEKLRTRKAIERRARMRRLQREDTSREQSVSGMSDSGHEGSVLSQTNGPLRHLNRGFHKTFNAISSNQRLVPMQKPPPSQLSQENSAKLMMSGALAANSTVVAHVDKRIKHARSQTVNMISRTSLKGPASKSMPPPKRFINRASLVPKQNPELKPFIGTGFLQNATLRREAMDFARRSGSITTTSSDYFRLKARNIDPDTRVISSTRKRGRDSGDSFASSLTSKSRRLSESSISTLSLSENTRDLLAKSSLSDSAQSLVIGRSNRDGTSTNVSITPKYTDEEDALFEAARRLRETLAEETTWMRSMREERQINDDSLKMETPAQRRLREFEATPSKTSVRLRQTHANGLLSPDYFEKKETTKYQPVNQEPRADVNINGGSTTKMGLAALSRDRNLQANHVSSSKASSNNGTSIEDAIEL